MAGIEFTQDGDYMFVDAPGDITGTANIPAGYYELYEHDSDTPFARGEVGEAFVVTGGRREVAKRLRAAIRTAIREHTK